MYRGFSRTELGDAGLELYFNSQRIRKMNALMVSMIAFTAGIKTRLTREEKGATAVEYGIMVALIAVVVIGAVSLLGNQILAAFNSITSVLPPLK
jgi:pilus assembly protein Flp/PilA